nr:hypothetical protein [Tanacetum cinerariifolium]
PIGSKEEAKRLKRKGINLEKEQVKKQKLSEEAPETETSTEEFTEDKIKEIMQGGSESTMGFSEGIPQHHTSIK